MLPKISPSTKTNDIILRPCRCDHVAMEIRTRWTHTHAKRPWRGWCIRGGSWLENTRWKQKEKDKEMESPPSLFKSEDEENRMQKNMHVIKQNKLKIWCSMPMDATHWIIVDRERVRTPATHGKGISHPYTPNKVGLSRLIRSHVWLYRHMYAK